MLSHLSIKNFALIDRLGADFSEGMNVFTGETGAGKSIIIDAIRFALGERMNSSQVRDPAMPCSVEIVVDLAENSELLKSDQLVDFLSPEDPRLIVRRAFLPDGRNKTTINGMSVTVRELKDIGALLVDIHGPYAHQTLFSESAHLDILDRLSGLSEKKEIYHLKYSEFTSLSEELQKIEVLSSSRERELETLAHQIKELKQVSLTEDAYNEVLEASARSANAEKLYSGAAELMSAVSDENTGLSETLRKTFVLSKNISGTDPGAQDFCDTIEQMQDICGTLEDLVADYLESLSFSPEETIEINKKYDSYYDILRKYGPTIQDASKFYSLCREKFDMLSDLENNTSGLTAQIRSLEVSLKKEASSITLDRKRSAQALKSTIEKELKELGMPHIKFECRVLPDKLSSTGQDKVSFHISPNAGEPVKPLAEIASSGEAARVLLALKKALTQADPVPCLIFDEIDAQIGGRLGSTTGKKLKELSADRQIILITHLPQIASFGNSHFKISKKVVSGRTSVNATLISGDERKSELAKMMSGEKETRTALDHAKDMLENAR